MAWSTPPTFVTGNVLTAAQMNSYVRDNTNFLFDAPACLVFNSIAVAFGTGTTVGEFTGTFDSESYDTDTMHSLVSNIGRLTVNTAGVYAVTGGGVWASNVTGAVRRLSIFRNGAELTTQIVQNSSAVTCEITVTCIRRMTVTDYFSLGGAQNSGGSLNLTGQGSFTGPYLSAHWLGNGV